MSWGRSSTLGKVGLVVGNFSDGSLMIGFVLKIINLIFSHKLVNKYSSMHFDFRKGCIIVKIPLTRVCAPSGMCPARQAAVAAGIPHQVPSYSVNMVCGSGMLSIVNAHNHILLNPNGSFLLFPSFGNFCDSCELGNLSFDFCVVEKRAAVGPPRVSYFLPYFSFGQRTSWHLFLMAGKQALND